MDSKTKMLLLALVGFFFFSCSSTEGERSIEMIDFSSPQLIHEGIEDWIQIEKDVQLNVPDSISIGKVTQIEFSDSKIFMLEMGVVPSILVFDREGGFKNRISKVGNGPGEYAQIEFFVLRENSILVYDRSQQKFIDYALSDFTQFQESKTTDYFLGGIGGLPDDGLFMVSDSDLEEELYKGYGFFNADLSLQNYQTQPSGYVEAFLPGSITLYDQGSYLIQSFTEKVFRITPDSLAFVEQIDFGSKKIPAEVASFSDADEFYESLTTGSYYFAVHNLLIREASVGFNFFNENIENLNFGLIQNGQAYRFPINSYLKELFFKPITVREGLFHTVLLPGEFDEEVTSLLNTTEIDYEKPVLVSYFIEK